MTEFTGLLKELESLLVEQLSLAQSGRFDELAASVERADELVDRMGAVCGAQGEPHGRRIERIRRLHRQLYLTLAGQKQELADKVGRMRRGRKVLRAYRESPG